MEHLITFSFNIDDEHIQQELEKAAVKEVTRRFDEGVLRAARRENGWIRGYKTVEEGMMDYMEKSVDEFVKANGDKIVEIAGKMLADKLARTKRGRELLEQNSH